MKTSSLLLSFSVLFVVGCSGQNNFQAINESSQALDSQAFEEVSAKQGEVDFTDPKVISLLEALAPKTDLSSETSSGANEAEEAGTDEKEEMIPEPPAKISKDVSEKGTVTPTVYYFPVIDEDDGDCSKKIDMRDSKGKKLIRICRTTQSACALQGSCAIVQDGELRSFNISGRAEKHDIFFEMTEHDCKFGYGVKSSCLDPFYTLAADMSIYRPGDVIYMPTVRGLKLPDGTDHSGYFVVRDSGRAIIGKGRFDFFSGYYPWRSDENPFSKIGLTSKKTRIPYYRIRGELAKAVQSARSFPRLPEKAIDERP